MSSNAQVVKSDSNRLQKSSSRTKENSIMFSSGYVGVIKSSYIASLSERLNKTWEQSQLVHKEQVTSFNYYRGLAITITIFCTGKYYDADFNIKVIFAKVNEYKRGPEKLLRFGLLKMTKVPGY